MKLWSSSLAVGRLVVGSKQASKSEQANMQVVGAEVAAAAAIGGKQADENIMDNGLACVPLNIHIKIVPDSF